MSLSQIPEVFGIAFLPFALRRFGFRAVMSGGIATWVIYHGLMASDPTRWLAMATLPLAGVAIAMFHISGPIYLDTVTAPAHRASVQGLYILATTGMGNLFGNLLAGETVETLGGAVSPVFVVPALINVAALVAIVMLFRAPRRAPAAGAPGGVPTEVGMGPALAAGRRGMGRRRGERYSNMVN
jgi:MFS family permease